MDENVAVTLARIEGKLDLMNSAIVANTAVSLDHETRLRSLETKPYVTTKMLTGWIFMVTALATAIPFLSTIHFGVHH